ncbi:MAG: hypothetical protein ACYC2O_00870 [Microthrixaceae bacterium]
MTATDVAPTGSRDARQELLDRLAEPGLDLDAARAELVLRRGRRRRARQAVGGVCVVLLLALAGGVVLLGGGDGPDELVADRDEDVSTSSSTTTTPSPEPQPEPAQLDAPPPPVVTSSTTAPPATTTEVALAPAPAPPSTHAPNQMLQATLTVLTPEVPAGGVAAVSVSWSDPDLGHGAAGPRHVVAWGDPLVAMPVDTTAAAPCDAPGPTSSGADTLQFRYSTPGTYHVQVTVETCGGQGAYGERVTLTTATPITVLAPDFVDADDPTLVVPGQSVVVFTPALPQDEPWPPLSSAVVELVTMIDPDHPVLLRDVTGPVVFTTSGPATVLVVPQGSAGTIRVRWSEPTRCATTASGDLAGPDGSVLSLPLASAPC